MTQPAVDEKKAPSRSSGQKIWGFLLVVDSVFVVIFGGVLAYKIHQHWQAPSVDAAPKNRKAVRVQAAKPEPKKEEPAPAKAEAKPEPAPAPKPEPAKPAAKAEPDAPRPPKPSLLHEAPARQAAQPQGSAAPKAAAPAPAPAADASAKAVPHEFSIKQPGAKSVELAGAFLVRTGGRKPMISHPDGNWTLTLYLTPNTYRYWFLVNGKKTLDPQNAKTDRGASVVTVIP